MLKGIVKWTNFICNILYMYADAVYCFFFLFRFEYFTPSTILSSPFSILLFYSFSFLIIITTLKMRNNTVTIQKNHNKNKFTLSFFSSLYFSSSLFSLFFFSIFFLAFLNQRNHRETHTHISRYNIRPIVHRDPSNSACGNW